MLLPKADRKGRLPPRSDGGYAGHFGAHPRGKTHQIYSAIQTGASHGMCTMETSLAELFNLGLITEDDALSKANHPLEVKALITPGTTTSNLVNRFGDQMNPEELKSIAVLRPWMPSDCPPRDRLGRKKPYDGETVLPRRCRR